MRLALAIVTIVLALAAAACHGSGTKQPKSKDNAKTSRTKVVNVTLPARSAGATCTAFNPNPTVSDAGLDQSVAEGPIVFYDATANSGARASYKPVVANRYTPAATLVLVRRGHAALVEVPMNERKHVSLVFPESKIVPGQAEPVSYGAAAIVFPYCKVSTTSAWLGYQGAVMVAGPRCARLLVQPLVRGTHKPLGKPVRVRVPYGRACKRHA